jgi:hypothetical protein
MCDYLGEIFAEHSQDSGTDRRTEKLVTGEKETDEDEDNPATKFSDSQYQIYEAEICTKNSDFTISQL